MTTIIAFSRQNRDFKIRRRDGNTGVKKTRLNKQNNNFSRASNVFVYFFIVFERLRRENVVHVRSIVFRKPRSRTRQRLIIFFFITYCCYINDGVQLKAEMFFVSLYSGTVVIVMMRKMPRLPEMLKL